MKMILSTAFVLVLFATPLSARSIDCVRGTVKFVDKPTSVTISCDAPKRAARRARVKSASLVLPAAGASTR